MKTANGVITKELALALIDEAIAKKIALDQLCQSDITLMTKLQKMEEGLLKSLGLLELFGKIKPEDPVQQLYKMRDKLAKEKDGAIIYSP
jgi:hypothetical protein